MSYDVFIKQNITFASSYEEQNAIKLHRSENWRGQNRILKFWA